MTYKFNIYEKESIGIAVSRVTYSTNIKTELYPNFAELIASLEDRILLEFGTTKEEAKKDQAYSMDFIVKRKPQLGAAFPMADDNYTLVITSGGCLKRINREFRLTED